MRLIVTGASGHLGRRVTELLLDGGVAPADLILVTRRPEELGEVAARGADVRAGDFDDPASLRAAFAGGDRLLLISTDALGRRVPQHQAAIDAAKAAGVGFVAYTSLVKASADNPAAVAGEHLATEEHLRASGLQWALLRNALYSELQVPTAAGAIAGGVFATNIGDGRAAYISRDDCAAVAAVVLRGPGHEGETYEITGPTALTAEDIAAAFSEAGGRPVEVVRLEDEAYIAGLVEHGVPAEAAPLFASFGRAAREGFDDLVTDVVERLTGRAPASLADVLARHRDQLVQPAAR